LYVLTVFMLVSMALSAALAEEPHNLFEQRCARCHSSHAGIFVRDSLEYRQGKVIGKKTGAELQSLLATGHGKLDPRQVAVMVGHLTAIFKSNGLFMEKCGICHERAVTLAHLFLRLAGDEVVGRYSGRSIALFLSDHGRLDENERATIIEMLKRQLASDIL
jgi:hypothetical protein